MKTKISVLAVALALVAGLAWAGYTTLIYKDSGGNKMVVASGGEVEVQSGGLLNVEGGKLNLTTGTGAVNTSLLLGGGTSAAPNTTAVANSNFVELRGSTTATTAGSDSRLAYLRLGLDGATTGGGETLRAFTNVNAAVGTAHGAHTSLSFGASGSVTGQAIASRNTLHLKAGTATGTVAPLQAEIYLDAATSAPPAASHSLIRGVVAGDATNKASVKTAISLEGVQATAASSGVADMVTTGAADAVSNTRVKIKINGTDYWLLATSAAPAP